MYNLLLEKLPLLWFSPEQGWG